MVLTGIIYVIHSQELSNATCEVYDCTRCYNLLVHSVLKSDVNQYNLQRTFFPPDSASPVSVIVYYNFRNETGDIDESKRKVWFWTSSTFYHIEPISVLQYLSLYFTDPSPRVSYLNITLDLQCENASDDYMQLLTQRVIIIMFLIVIHYRHTFFPFNAAETLCH